MSDFDAAAFRTKAEQLSDDELIALVSINASRYAPEAVEIAKLQVDARGLSADIQNVHFDVFLNTSGFAGRLILLDEQIMFLSTGMRAGSGIGIDLIGSIVDEVRLATRNLAAARSDFSALDNEGSWIYYVDQIRDFQTKSSLLAGKQLLFEVAEEDGTTTNGVIRCDELSASEFEALVKKINEAISRCSNPPSAD